MNRGSSNGVSAEEVISAELDEGEVVLWSGRPDVRSLLKDRTGGWFAVALTWIFFGVVAFVAYGIHSDPARKHEPGAMLALLVLIMLAPALITTFVVMSYFRLRDCARGTVYFITDRRAGALIPHKRGRIVRVFYRSGLAALRRVDRANGFGDITFESVLPVPTAPSPRFELGFYAIQDAAKVERLLRNVGATPASNAV